MYARNEKSFMCRGAFVCFAAPAVAFMLAVAAQARAELIAHWTFDEITGQVAYDATGHGYNGRLGSSTEPDVNDPGMGIAGKIGKAYNFDATDDYVYVADADPLDGMVKLTLSAWFVLDSVTQTTDRTIIRKWESALPRAYTLGVCDSSSSPKLGFFFYPGSAKYLKSDTLTNLVNQGLLTLNTWQHLAGVYDGSTAYIYLNGVQVASMSATGNIGASAAPLYFGGWAASAPWKGGLDDLGILNEALSAAKVKSLSTTPRVSGLEGYDLSKMYKLFGVYDTGTPATIGTLNWEKVAGLGRSPGDAWFEGGCYYVQLGATDGVKAIPEPSMLTLLAAGLLGMFVYAWRKRK